MSTETQVEARLQDAGEYGATAIAAEGARVAFVTCTDCGAAVLVDPRDPRDVLQLHRDYHRRGVEDIEPVEAS